MLCPLLDRALRRGTFALALSASLTAAPSVHAANEFAITPAQIQTLGITLQRLDGPADIQGQAYPARVVVPTPQEQVVSAPLAGLVDQVLVSENDAVRRGQPLLRLVSPELGELQLRALEAASKSQLSQKTAQRERALYADGIISERRAQEAEREAEADRARLQQAEVALRLAGVDDARIRQIRAGGALRNEVTVQAQASGTVLSLDVKPGQRVAQADALMRLADTRQLWLDIQLPADRRAQIAMKQGVITVVGREVSASPLSMSAMVSDGQTLMLRARVTQGAALLRPGEVVQAQVPFATGSEATNPGWPVPVSAVVRQDNQAYVFVRTAQGFVAQAVTVVNSAGNAVQVQGPLKAGQEIATRSVIALKAAWLGQNGDH